MRRRAVAGLALGAAMTYLAIAGCTAFNDAPAPIYPNDAIAAKDAAPGAVDSGCPRAPVPTTAPDPKNGTGGTIEVVVAVHSISLGVSSGKVAPDFGYDLDGVCTCSPDPPSCINKADAGNCDSALGRDDAMGMLLASLPIGDPSSYANDAVTGGGRGLLARIQNYNGQANDDHVDFSLYRSPGTVGAPDFTNPAQAWKVDTADLVASGGDKYAARTTGSAFVKDGQLVVQQLASSAIPFNSDTDIVLQQVSFVGNLKQDPGGNWYIEHAIGVGRWVADAALNTVAHVQDPTNSHQRICNNSAELLLLAPKICAAADIVDNSIQDNKGQFCNAISTAVELETVPAVLGDIVTTTPDDPCAGVTIGTCD